MLVLAGDSLLTDPTFWVGSAFVVFVILLIWKKVPGMIASGLDARIARITDQLEEARTLREDAQQVLAKLQRQQRDAADEAEAIIAHAKEDAKLLAAEAAENVEAMVQRRQRLAEDRIAQAEAKAIADVQAAAVAVATSAATAIIAEDMQGPARDALLDAAIGELDTKLN